MRIVGGKYRRRLLEYPPETITRPTMDKVREALMSAIGEEIRNRNVLDLFAGSGALGIESLSRGAARCVFVDSNYLATETIARNIRALGVEEETRIEKKDAVRFLEEQREPFSLVFLDPPYRNKEIYPKCIGLLKERNLLSEEAILVVESEEEREEDPYFSRVRTYKYGRIHISISWRSL